MEGEVSEVLDTDGRVAFLTSLDGFRALEPEVLRRVAPHMKACRHRDGALLMGRGEPGRAMHIVLEGEVQVLDVHGVEIDRMGRGAMVGEMALLSGEPRRADVRAVGITRTLCVHWDQVRPLLKEEPAFSDFLAAVVSQRLEASGGRGRIGKYRIDASLGKGASARVFRAVHPTLGRPVAIKMLAHARTSDPVFAESFLREARTIADLVHPNIVQVYDAEESHGTTFLVMELVDGIDGDQLLRRNGPLPCAQVADIVAQLFRALQYSHARGVVHRDVKPANFLWAEDGTAKLMDFGLAEHVDPEETDDGERARAVSGTPNYLAPEVALGLRVDGRADIYSLGVLAFELLTGRVPFVADRLGTLLQMHVRLPPPAIRTLRPDVTEGLAAFVEGAMAKDPDERLVDPDTVLALLGKESSASVAACEWMTLTYPSEAQTAVDDAFQTLRATLEPLGVVVARAVVKPVER